MEMKGLPPRPPTITPEKFRELRESIGYSQEELAEYMGVNTRTVGRWELGRTRIPQACSFLLLYLVLQIKTKS
jgi:DNA-binding transcriptional regulator YiaG